MDLVEQLNHIFYPRTIAVVGASTNPEKAGFMCLENLLEAGFRGKIYPVNPGLSEAFGLKAYSSVKDIPGEIDLAMVVIPAQLAMPVIEECIVKGIKGVILITGGFREVGTEFGSELQAKIRDVATRSGMRVIGPNTLGLINPSINLNATFQSTLSLSKVGNVAVVTQSGGMLIHIAHTLTDLNIGMSKAIGLGNRCDLDFDEVVTYLAQDEETRVMILYMEGIEQPRKLMKVARQVVKQKPILVYKGGRSGGIDRATFSHTGALAGEYQFYKAAFTQAGMIEADDLTELVDITKALIFQPPSSGNRVAVLSVQAGPGIVIADRCRRLGLRLAELSPATRQRLRQLASPLSAVDNPVDIAWKTSEFDVCREMFRVVLEDAGVDGVIVAAAFFPPGMEVVRAVIDIAGYCGKPITVCLYSPLGMAYAELHALEESRIPVYPFPERAVAGLAGLVRYGRILREFD